MIYYSEPIHAATYVVPSYTSAHVYVPPVATHQPAVYQATPRVAYSHSYDVVPRYETRVVHDVVPRVDAHYYTDYEEVVPAHTVVHSGYQHPLW
jgi:hypothetical protein